MGRRMNYAEQGGAPDHLSVPLGDGTRLFFEVRTWFSGRAPPAVKPRGFMPNLPPKDDSDFDGYGESLGDSINGLTVIIDYRDAKGQASTRQVSCVRIENAGGKRYLRAFCHQRRALRVFLIDRIRAVMDAETGEELTNGDAFFDQYINDRITNSPLGWGLSPIQRADLGAGLSVLTFLARCDGHIHPSELDEIETFIAAWWMRAEISAEIPEQDIAAYARRLAPDVEAFVIAAQRVGSDALLRQLIAGYARRVVEADGIIAAEERHWIRRLVEWLMVADQGMEQGNA